jgi:dolichol-phosphate mannosyltransferase
MDQNTANKSTKIVVIPTYNEIENINKLFDVLLSIEPTLNILIVDDNSPDGTSEAVRKRMEETNRIHLLKRAGKMGLGTAYCDGFQYAIKAGFDYIFQMDADFSHDPKDLLRFIDALQEVDIVLGSRYVTGVNVVNWPMSRLLLSYFANVYTRIITGMPVKDATGGFKGFRAEVLKKINFATIKSNGYAFQIEMTFRLWVKGAKIKELPIIFIDRINGVSKMSKNIVYEAAYLVWKLKIQSIFNKKSM